MEFWRTWKTCWCDRRNLVQKRSVLIALMLIAFSLAAMIHVHGSARAGRPPSRGVQVEDRELMDTGIESLREHSTIIITVMAALVVALFGASVTLVTINIKDLKEAARTHHEDQTKKMDKLEEKLAQRDAVLQQLYIEHKVMMGRCGQQQLPAAKEANDAS